MNRILAAVLFLAATPAFAADDLDEHGGIRVREWFARMSGTIEADAGTGLSTRIDLASDLALGSRNLTHEIQAYAGIPLIGRIYAGWWEAEDSGSRALSRTIEFAGQTYPVTTQINSSATLDVFYLDYEFAFPAIPLGDLCQLEFALQAGARGLRGEGSINAPSIPGSNASHAGWVGFPTLGGHVTASLFSCVRAELEVLGMAFSYGSDRMSYLEAFAEVVAQPLPWVFIGVGYKYANLKIQHLGTSIFDFEVRVDGIYLTAGLRF